MNEYTPKTRQHGEVNAVHAAFDSANLNNNSLQSV